MYFWTYLLHQLLQRLNNLSQRYYFSFMLTQGIIMRTSVPENIDRHQFSTNQPTSGTTK